MSTLKQIISSYKSKLRQDSPQMLRGFVVHNDMCPKVKVPAARYKCLTMDDMLIPSGSWKDHHKKRNAYYNTVFIIGLTSLVASIICLKENVFFNAYPPPYPFIEDTDAENENNEEE